MAVCPLRCTATSFPLRTTSFSASPHLFVALPVRRSSASSFPQTASTEHSSHLCLQYVPSRMSVGFAPMLDRERVCVPGWRNTDTIPLREARQVFPGVPVVALLGRTTSTAGADCSYTGRLTQACFYPTFLFTKCRLL
jgi:hypothetical protein